MSRLKLGLTGLPKEITAPAPKPVRLPREKPAPVPATPKPERK